MRRVQQGIQVHTAMKSAKKKKRQGKRNSNQAVQFIPNERNTELNYIKIGSRLRHARHVHRLKLRELAEKVGCSESLLSKIENDKVQPSLQMLHRILSQLDSSIAHLFSRTSDNEHIVMRAGERQIIPTGPNNPRKKSGVQLEWLVPYPDSRLLSGSIHIVAPGGGSEGLISHEGEEVGYILEGELELTVGAENFHLKAGDSFFFTSDKSHGYRNPGKAQTRIIWINTPPTF